MKKYTKFIVLAFIVGLIALFLIFDLKKYLSLNYLKDQQDLFINYYDNNPFQTIAIYMGIYITSTALSLPGAAILTLLGGALFGVFGGTLIVSFASTIGASLAFLVARFLMRETVQTQFKDQLKTINKGVEKEGAFYLFTLRLIPAVPFFVINLAMGLTNMRLLTFFLVSQAGMLAGTVVYVNAGTQLSQIDSLKGIASPQIILSFIALGLFPIATKKIMKKLTQKKGIPTDV